MSKIALSGNASGTGVFTIASPNSNSDRTLNLPDNSGTVLTSASNLAGVTGVGKVLQVVNATYSTQVVSSSSTFADTGLTASITPTSASSKILVLVNQAGCGKQNSNTYLYLRLLRGATDISYFERLAGYNGASTDNFFGSCSVCYLDSPATTSATTYKTQLASGNNTSQVYTQVSNGVGINTMSTITLMEIAA
jgi:hypothetical protein